ncbi:RNA-directed DNA polymerase [Citrus sinensis]|uniref:RNA-directed DNA polymerase n=1 Tax=Citrus sinensis TaxID=2711 RepID=A0ACB8IMH4_CITSI|nr:RNA-directed DNA polymerase [Citrus sinensis]
MGNSGNQNISQVKSVIVVRGGKVVKKHIQDPRETSKDSILENMEKDNKIGHALLDLGASVNLLPYSVYQQFNLGELKPTSTTLLLTDRSIKVPKRIIEDVLVLVNKFIYPVDFIVLETEPIVNECKQIPVILGRPFLATSNALINCKNGLMKFSFGNMTLELNVFNMCKQPHHQKDDDNENEEIDLIEPIVEEHIQDENSIKSIEICFAGSFESSKELDCDIANTYPTLDSMQVPTGDYEQSNFEDTTQPEELNEKEAPKLKLKPLSEELKYAYLGKQQTYPVVISSQLMRDKKSPIMQPPDWSLPFELICDASDYAVGVVQGQRKEGKPFVIYYASRTLNSAQMNYTTTEKELLAVIFALDKFHSYLIGSFTIVYSDYTAVRYLMSKQDAKSRLIRWILLLQEFNLTIKDKKGAENVVANHLSRLTNEFLIETTPINDSFPDEFLFSINKMLWYANIVNYLAIGEMPCDWSSQEKKKFLTEVKSFYWDDPYLFSYCSAQIF